MTSLPEVLRAAIKQSCNWLTSTRRPHPRELESSLEEQKQTLARLLAEESRKPVEFAASFAQVGLWCLNRLQPASAAYNLPVGLRLLGPLDRHALERSLQEIVNRHGALRTRFELGETQLLQVVIPRFIGSLPIVDLSHLPEPQRSQETWQLALSETQLAFDLSQVPPFRLKLFRLQPDDHVLICVMHHIISDNWSLRVFVSELCALYGAYSSGQESPLEPLPIQYGDYTVWQREAMTGEAVLNQTLYWKRKLQGVPPLTQLPLDPNLRAQETTETAVQAAPLSKELVDGLKQLSVGQDATLFMIALAAFTVLLWWRTRQEDIPIGVPYAGRDGVETEPLIGYFVNMLVLRTNVSGNPRFCDFLSQVREVTLEALCNCDVPFVRLVEELNPDRSTNRHANPLFQVIFAVIKAAVEPRRLGDLNTAPFVVTSGNSPVDLTLHLIETSEGARIVQFEYNTGLFSREHIAILLSEYVYLLGAVAAEPQLRISELLLAKTC